MPQGRFFFYYYIFLDITCIFTQFGETTFLSMTLDHLKNSAILTNLFRMEEDDDLKGASEFIRSKRKLVARACWGGVEVGGVVADGLDKRYRLTDFFRELPFTTPSLI